MKVWDKEYQCIRIDNMDEKYTWGNTIYEVEDQFREEMARPVIDVEYKDDDLFPNEEILAQQI